MNSNADIIGDVKEMNAVISKVDSIGVLQQEKELPAEESCQEEDSVDSDDSDLNEERPFSPADIDIDVKDITVFSVMERIKNKEIVLDPEYQRNGNIWNHYRQCQLIESMLLGIPLPMFYFSIDNDIVDDHGLKRQSWQIVDGLQRLSVIRNFMIEFRDPSTHEVVPMRLEGMQYLKSLEGKSYEELPDALKRTLLEVNLKVNIIRKSTPREVKLNIFRRLNTGGMPLSMQEIRHATHSHGASRLLKKMANSNEFKLAVGQRVNCKRMGDREYVNRFLAFYINGVDLYRGMDLFLDVALDRIDKWIIPAKNEDKEVCQGILDQIESNFYDALNTIRCTLGEMSFVKIDQLPQADPRKVKAHLNKALFEVLTVCVAKLSNEARKKLIKLSGRARVEYESLFMDKSENGLSDIVSTSTGRTSRVRRRYEIVGDYLLRLTGENVNWKDELYA